MSAVITWYRSSVWSAPLSSYATTVLGMMQQLNAALIAFEGESGSRWEICSSELSTAPYYITLKRKTNAAGRILFMGFTGAVSPFNPQLQNYAPSSNQISAAFFPSATSDTPANISSSSGDVFTNPQNSTGLSASFYSSNSASRLRIFDCEDGVYVNVSATFIEFSVACGLLLEDKDEVAVPFVWRNATSFSAISPPTSIAQNTAGGISVDGTGRFFLGFGANYATNYATYLNDAANKEAYFLAQTMASFQRPYALFNSYKLRQIALGFDPVVLNEKLVGSGPVDVAYNSSGYTVLTSGFPWLTNFKV